MSKKHTSTNSHIQQNPLTVLKAVKAGDFGQVTYYYEDNTRQIAPINREMFTNDKGKPVGLTELLGVFQDTVWDRKAVKFELSI